MSEIITICIGGAGCRIGQAFWELLSLEHGIQPDGHRASDAPLDGENDPPNAFFSVIDSGKYIPRTLFFDTEAAVVDEVRTGTYRQLFHPEQLVSGKANCSGNFARGYHTIGGPFLEKVLSRIRNVADDCKDLQGFIIIHSMGGGTGSGFTSLLMEHLSTEYVQKSKIRFAIYPGPYVSTTILGPYNTILCTDFTSEHTDGCFIIDNEAVYDTLRQQLYIERPTYANLNALIADGISSATASLRFSGEFNESMNELLSSLVPDPQMPYLYISLAPYLLAGDSELTVEELTRAVFQNANQLAKCDSRYGKYLSCNLFYRGDVNLEEVNAAISKTKTEQKNLSSIDPKVGIINQRAQVLPGRDKIAAQRSVTLLVNNTAIAEVYARMYHKFDLMFNKRAYVHRFLEEGMKESEFIVARENLANLELAFEKIGTNAVNGNSSTA